MKAIKKNLEWYIRNFSRQCDCRQKIIIHAYRPNGRLKERVSGSCQNKNCSKFGQEKFF